MAYALLAYPPAILALMVTIEVPRARPRVTLGALLAARDASLAVRAGARMKIAAAIGVAAGQVRRLVVTLLTLTVAGLLRHGLVLGGLAAWVWAAWSFSPLAGQIAAGAALFFLEARRR